MMFHNRELSIRMRKPNRTKDNNKETPEETIGFDVKVAEATVFVKTVLRYIAVGVAGYVVLDTYRQVLIAKNTNRPQH